MKNNLYNGNKITGLNPVVKTFATRIFGHIHHYNRKSVASKRKTSLNFFCQHAWSYDDECHKTFISKKNRRAVRVDDQWLKLYTMFTTTNPPPVNYENQTTLRIYRFIIIHCNRQTKRKVKPIW